MKMTRDVFCFVFIQLMIWGWQLTAQENHQGEDQYSSSGERYLRVEIADRKDIAVLSRFVSVDRVEDDCVYVYAGKDQYPSFQALDYAYSVCVHPGKLYRPEMRDKLNISDLQAWDFYPTYSAYLDIMSQFETNYPGLCQVFSIGQSIQGREIMVARISQNPAGKPQFLYTATMHGDETAGYVLCLHLIDHLLSNYGIDPRITTLVDNLDIWINPLANPDGTYAGGNHTVYGATRYNANGVDLNRNFPDPKDGPHPDGNPWQQETIIFMNLAEANHFVMSANMHGGAEVCNYPWDTWAKLHADDAWWFYVCVEYADTAQHYSPPGYMTDFGTGVTNGYQWYSISGGRQDYMNYFHQCREFTLELSQVKTIAENQLEPHWEYNKRSLLNYMEQAIFGIHGAVSDSITGNPVPAEVFIYGHDIDSSWVYASASTGRYSRPVYEGVYDVVFSAPGYFPKTIENITVVNRQKTIVDVTLAAGDLIAGFTASQTLVNAGGSVDFTDQTWGAPVSWEWTFAGGNPATSTEQNPQGIVYQESGQYDVSLTVTDGINTHAVIKIGYIVVNIEYLMQNGSITTCEGVFYDSGGKDANYSDNEDFTMTFQPIMEGGKIKADFLSFSVEYHSNCNYDWLKIYNGPSVSSPLIGTYCGSSSPGVVVASGTTGALTFRFHSDYAETEPGWEALISCEYEGQAPQADFTAEPTVILEGETIDFTDLSLNNPSEWLWTFEGGDPQTCNTQNPAVEYHHQGTYSVSLTVTNEFGSDTKVVEDFVTVNELVSLQKITARVKVTVFPLPASQHVYIVADHVISSVEVFSLTGEPLYLINVSEKEYRLPLGAFPQGVYLLRIKMGETVVTRMLPVIK